MIVNQTYEIDSCDDVELELKRESKLEFRLCFDDEKVIQTLFFIIPGLGGDADSNYREHLASFVAENFNVAVVSVNYHCIGNRPQTGAKAYFDEIDRLILEESCKTLGIKLPFDVSNIRIQFPKTSSAFNLKEFSKEFHFINEALEAKIKKKELFENFELKTHLTFEPTKNEYQNFGIMQAQDLINALLYIKANPPFSLGGGGFACDYARKLTRRIFSSFNC